MSFAKSIVAGLGLSLAAAFSIVMIGFIAQANIDIPGIVQITSGSDAAPQSSLTFNPFAVVVAAFVIGVLIWLVGRLARSRTGSKS